MEELKRMLFLQQKFMILNQYADESNTRCVDAAYAQAWDDEIYPLFDDAAPWHSPYDSEFKVSKERVEAVIRYMADQWDAKNALTFYGLEDHFNTRGMNPDYERYELVSIARYCKLHRRFDDEFWNTLLENGQCPSEAHSVWSDFEPSDVYFN